MPLYNYQCKSCEHTFDGIASISNRNVPNSEPCPECGVVGKVEIMIGAVAAVAGVNHRQKIPDGFKDRLREIKKFAGRQSTIDV